MPKPLTDHQAALEAMRRWGQDGRAWHPAREVKGGPSYCLVGTSNGRLYAHQWVVYGIGATWTAALLDASQRGN